MAPAAVPPINEPAGDASTMAPTMEATAQARNPCAVSRFSAQAARQIPAEAGRNHRHDDEKEA